MAKTYDLRIRPRISWLTLVLGILATPAAARADLLVNELNDKPVATGVVAQNPSHLSTASAFCPVGPAPREAAVELEPTVLLAMLTVCIHPPVDPPSPPPVISGSSGGGGNTIHTASVSPEPNGLVIGLIGAGVAGLTVVVRRRRSTLVA
jgi:hypothetical protein